MNGLRTVSEVMELEAEVLRPLGPDDLARLSDARGSREEPTVKRMHDRHHALAKALASGMTATDAAALVGYTVSRVSVLRRDPSFKELETHYLADANKVWRDTHARMASLTADAVNELHTRLEETPEAFGVDDLLEIGKTFADRTGFGPSSKSTNVNVTVDMSDRINAARRRADEAKLIEGEVLK